MAVDIVEGNKLPRVTVRSTPIQAHLSWTPLSAARVGERAGGDEPRSRRPAAALVVWAILAAVGAGPIAGQIRPRFGPGLLAALAAGVVAVALTPQLFRRLSWTRLLYVSFALAAGWAILLAVSDGFDALGAPLATRYEYLPDVPLVGSPVTFLQTFAERIGSFALHVRGHPPGMLLLLWAMDRAGLAGVGWEVLLVVAGGAAAVPAALLALRHVAGDARARAAAPFLILMPAAVWMATSADAFFTGVSAWGVALVILASGRDDRRGDLLAAGGGALLGASFFLSYGLVLVAIVPLMVAVARRRFRPVLVASLAVGAVFLAFGASGFWWPEGLLASLPHVRSTSAHRSYAPFLLFNLGAFAIVLGPAIPVALAGLRERGVWLLAGAGLLAVVAADVTGLSKGEVERIWLPFVPWVALAAGSFADNASRSRADAERGQRLWLAVHVLAALAVQAVFRTPW
ncbi:MAG: hypothetical protein H0W27_00920 [Actinobacteria bacterium]|nr:hypothetical protein [Actinomycetota bacterium]